MGWENRKKIWLRTDATVGGPKKKKWWLTLLHIAIVTLLLLPIAHYADGIKMPRF